MVDRPTIFSGAMVSALLSGRKTQTRRLADSPLAKADAGDRLWVRESFRDISEVHLDPLFAGVSGDFVYMADGVKIGGHKWTPAIHMPRCASRLTLVVSEVRFQKLHDISEEDALAEGCIRLPASGRITDIQGGQYLDRIWPSARTWYAELWASLHGQESWDSNPDVVALSFSVHHANIDSLEIGHA